MNNYLPTDYQAFIHTSRYARWMEEEGRRETWGETVHRYMKNVIHRALPNTGEPVDDFDYGAVEREIRDAILGLEVMPSMRTLMTAGTAANRDNTVRTWLSMT